MLLRDLSAVDPQQDGLGMSLDASTKWLLACGPIGAFGFILVFLIAGALRPNDSFMYHHASSLSLGEGGWVQISNFIATGALMVACACGLRRSLAYLIPLPKGLLKGAARQGFSR
jgi:hypothetical protein